MNESEFEGTLVLEKLAEIGKIDDFYKAVDADDFGKARSLLRLAKISPEMIALVLKQMGGEED